MDEILFYALNEEFSGDGIGEMMVLITSPETWWAPLILLSVSLLIIDWRKGLTAILVALAAVGFGDWFAHNILKTYFGVIRPCNALEGVHLLVGCTQSFSFPSNHAVNSLAVAGAIGFWFPPLFSNAGSDWTAGMPVTDRGWGSLSIGCYRRRHFRVLYRLWLFVYNQTVDTENRGMTWSMQNRAVFLDRDGCVNMEDDHIRDIAQFRLYPDSLDSIKKLNEAGFWWW